MSNDPDALGPDFLNALAAAANEAVDNLGVEDSRTMKAMQALADALHKEGSFALAKDLQGRVACQLRSDLGATHPDARAAFSKLELMVQTTLLLSTLRSPVKSPIASEGYKLLGAWREAGDPMSWNALFGFAAKHMDDAELAPLRAFVFDLWAVGLMRSPGSGAEFYTAELRDGKQEAQLEAMMERFPILYEYLMLGYTSQCSDDDEEDD